MVEVVGIVFNNNKRIYYFLPNNKKLKKGITVIVETERGLEFGKVEVENFMLSEKSIKEPLKGILRIATKDDFKKYQKNENDGKEALKFCREIVKQNDYNMVIIDAHYTFDRDQLIFKFLSDSRVDFRNLAKKLATKYKTRIELRQIGSRDKAREISGCGQCGQKLCCSRFLKELDSVSINMAKNQGIALNPNKINGVCGRLLCCLQYEDDNYAECRKCLPKIGQTIDTEQGKGKVIMVDVLQKTYQVSIPQVGVVKVSK